MPAMIQCSITIMSCDTRNSYLAGCDGLTSLSLLSVKKVKEIYNKE